MRDLGRVEIDHRVVLTITHTHTYTTTTPSRQIIPQPALVGFMNALAIILVKGQAEAFLVCTDVRV